MKTKINFALRLFAVAGLLIAFNPGVTEAQILRNITKRVGEKVEQEANRRAERKVDQAINKGFDEVEKGLEGKDGAARQKDSTTVAGGALLEQLMGGLSADVTLKEAYDFKIGVTYDVITQDHNGQNDPASVMSMWFADAPYVATETTEGDQSMIAVIDDGQIIMFNLNDKSYMALSSNTLDAFGQAARDAGAEVEEEESESGKVTMKRLADETVLGYSCKVYEFTAEDVKSTVWYTEELNINMFESYMNSMGSLTKYATGKLPEEAMEFKGVMMKMESRDMDGASMIMEARQVNRDGKTITSSEYKRMGMN